MPPKGWRKYPDGFKPTNAAGTPAKDKDQFSLDDLLFPRSTVLKLAKETFTDGGAAAAAPIPKDAQTALARSASMFVSYIALEANTIARGAGRKTVLPSDVFRALENVQFGAFAPKVREDLAVFESHTAARKEQQRERRERGITKVFENEIVDDDEELLIEDDDATATAGESTKENTEGAKDRKAGGEPGAKKRKETVVKIPKQRGRKKKAVVEAEATATAAAEKAAAETAKETKRPRGRPGRPKAVVPTEDEETEPEENEEDDEMDVDEEQNEDEEEDEEENEDEEDEEEESGHKVVSGMPEARELEQGGLDDDSTAEETRSRGGGSEDEEDEEDEKLNARR
jgi:DNA polymerase epsilon subunit 3